MLQVETRRARSVPPMDIENQPLVAPSVLNQVDDLLLLRSTLLGGIHIGRVQTRRVIVKHVGWHQLARLQEHAARASEAQLKQGKQSSNMRKLAVDDPWAEQEIARTLMEHPHPHIVKYLDAASSLDGMSFALEFCDEGDLLDYLERLRQPCMPEAQALNVIRAISSALSFLHGRGIAHRDVSLENILVHQGQYKLADFGLACHGYRQCLDRAGKGYYVAPEVVNECDAYDPMAADVWSLGIVLFVLLTSSPLVPVASNDDQSFQVFSRVGVRAVLDAWDMSSSISSSTQDLLTQMLQIDPTKRPTMSAVLAHLGINEHSLPTSMGADG